LKLQDIAARLDCRLEGDGAIDIRGVAGIEAAGPGDLTFFANPKYAAELRATRASAVILGDNADRAPCAMLRARQPYLAFARAVSLFENPWRPAPGVHKLAWVADGVVLGDDVSIGPFAVVEEGARIGSRTIVHAHVAIGRQTEIGDVGSDGFGFARRPDGTHEKIPQIGAIVVEDDVEIGANTTIDRPAVGETRIGAGTKIDNLVQVAHGVAIGKNVLLAAQVGIAGSVTIEDDVTLAGQVGVAGHITLGKGVVATAQTGIPNSVDAGALVSGYPAIPNREWLKASAVFRRLPELKKRVAELR
jgi:UDP-3-O-[3-hydroxymyristoyl] glucosamine N-acyltransferase